MLILPLHKPLDRSNFPLATLLLMLVNVLVFFTLQGSDPARMAKAVASYDNAGLVDDEAPAYARWLREHGRAEDAEQLLALPDSDRSHAVMQATLYDLPFLQALGEGALFDTPGQLADWRMRRAGYDAQLDQVFTQRYVLRHGEWSIKRMLSSAFLHGGVMHLLGNMLFLIAIGVLLEGAIGPAALLGVYLLGALGSSAASLLWRAGEIGGGLGASGAIAAMMGAFCVVWGRQPVRFFYWFGVVFDYARAPAIWLLPLWLGWEVYSLLSAPEAGVAFDAHAGGLVCGALLGAALVATGRRRDAFIADAPEPVGADDRWARAQVHLGRMENDQAEQLLAALAAEQPQRFEVALARYRAARNAGQAARIQQSTQALLAIVAGDGAQAAMQAEVLQQERPTLDGACRVALAGRWIELGQLKAVEALLQQAADLSRAEQALLWFRLALGHGETQARDQQQRLLQAVIERFPDLPQADKARFLLDNG
ncbi:rhomboid family intramembrane serine protease [Pseudoxanthomonas sp.]|uniref:rhomboid family intramembrane serine protease n=1 Tax=Pseudoxanthomonas sp. TaxID=1871049 RepID=UPI00261815F5|nr:rhomboid family intramembrane serine protease [Pseudoxanthomonas sp.]WDS36446.1 MAG: rhomboid family intramembrane serine protease [Pseudoxanthomonas sp.]